MWRQPMRGDKLAIALILLLSLIAIASCDTVEQNTIQIRISADPDLIQTPHQYESEEGMILGENEISNQILPYDSLIEQNNPTQELMMRNLDLPLEAGALMSHYSEMACIAADIEYLLIHITDHVEGNRELNQKIALLNVDYDHILSQECMMRLAADGNDSRSNLSVHQEAKYIRLLNSTLIT